MTERLNTKVIRAGLSLRSIVFAYLKKHSFAIFVGAALLLVTNGLSMLIPWQIKTAIDWLSGSGSPEDSVFQNAILILFVAAIAQGLIRIASRWVIFGIGRSVEAEIRTELFDFLLQQEPRYFGTQSVGDLMSRLSNDVQAIRALFGFALLNIINTAFALTLSLSMTFQISPRLAVFSLMPFPILFLIMARFSRYLQQHMLVTQQALGGLSSFLQEAFGGIVIVKSYGLTESLHSVFETHNQSYTQANTELAKIRSLLMPIMIVTAGIGSLITLYFGGRFVTEGSMTLGDLVAFQGYLALLVWPILTFGWLFSSIQRGMAAVSRLKDMVSTSVVLEHQQPLGALDLEHECAIRIAEGKGVLGGVEESSAKGAARDEFKIGPMNVSIPRGQWVGIAGATGSGKSALLRTIVGYFPRSGRYEIFGQEIDDTLIEASREYIAYVPTAPLLFDGTIEENLKVVRQDAEESELLSVLSLVSFDEDLAAFRNGLKTRVGEKGVTLSGGQKQRLALARAILSERPVLLLDDALSAVDAETEEKVCENIKKLGLTVCIATHRYSVLQRCSKVLTLDHGVQSEYDTPANLMQQDGVFAQLNRQKNLRDKLERELMGEEF